MKVSVQLKFDLKEMQRNINALISNAEIQFCNFYTSAELTQRIDVKMVYKQVFEQVERIGIGNFIAQKDDVAFEVIIYWKTSQVEVKSLTQHKQASLEFYVNCCLEVCHNFAMFELLADEDYVHKLGKHLHEGY